jgi:hypothetical protein
MSEELAVRIEETLANYAREHGQVYDAMAMHQSHLSARELAQDALTFGMDIWTHGSAEGGELGGNVVRLPVGRDRTRSRRFPGVRIALSTLGAIVGSTLIAAATTDAVNIPGFHHVAQLVYSKNAPPATERIIEDHGQVRRVYFVRHPGEAWNIIHVEREEDLTEAEIATLRDDDPNKDPPPHS